MKPIIDYVKQHTHPYKTEKSIFNIITGKKSHQTFFDACSQQLLSLYHSLPKLKYPSFERYFEQNEPSHSEFKLFVHPKYTYDSMVDTFRAIQLLVQTTTMRANEQRSFVPLVQSVNIQQRVKSILAQYDTMMTCHKQLYNELSQLFQRIEMQYGSLHLHYYLQGYDVSMYTRQQVSMITDQKQTTLYLHEYNQFVHMMFELEQTEQYPILAQCIMRPSLTIQANDTRQRLTTTQDVTRLANEKSVKENTIEDHILELFIKGYIDNYNDFVASDDIATLLSIYTATRDARLRYYKTQVEHLSYFQIKLIIIGYERGDLSDDA